jgi:DNA topoisomerase-1
VALDKQFPEIEKDNEKLLSSPDEAYRQHAEVAAVVMKMGLRPGSEKDTRARRQAYGITTLRGGHVVDRREQIQLDFMGKDGVHLQLPVEDKKIGEILTARASAAGKAGKLFPEVDDRSLRYYMGSLGKGKAGAGFTPKEFRTRLGTKIAEQQVKGMRAPKNEKEYKVAVKSVATAVSVKLGNTPTIALQSYIHPATFAPWRARL